MDDLQYLKTRASECFRGLKNILETLNRDFAKPDSRWEMDEEKMIARLVKLPSFEWEPFEEPNDQRFDDEDQERVMRK